MTNSVRPMCGRRRRAFRRARVVLLQLETPLRTIEASIELAAAAGLRVVLNPAPARPLPARLLERVYLLTPNESEAELLTGVAVASEAAAAKAADALLARGVQNVVITMGSRGAFVAGGAGRRAADDSRIQGEGHRCTGAGDVFNGALSSRWPKAGRCWRPRDLAARRRPFPSRASAPSPRRRRAGRSKPCSPRERFGYGHEQASILTHCRDRRADRVPGCAGPVQRWLQQVRRHERQGIRTRQTEGRARHEVARERVLPDDGGGGREHQAANAATTISSQRHQGRDWTSPAGESGRADDRAEGRRHRDRARGLEGAGGRLKRAATPASSW